MEEFLMRCVVTFDKETESENNDEYTYDYLDIDLNKTDDEKVVTVQEIKLKDDEGYLFDYIPQKNFHTPEEVIISVRYSCPYCSYKCNTTNSLVSHLQSHFGRCGRKRNFRCSTFGCKYSCKTVDDLKTHTYKCQKKK